MVHRGIHLARLYLEMPIPPPSPRLAPAPPPHRALLSPPAVGGRLLVRCVDLEGVRGRFRPAHLLQGWRSRRRLPPSPSGPPACRTPPVRRG